MELVIIFISTDFFVGKYTSTNEQDLYYLLWCFRPGVRELFVTLSFFFYVKTWAPPHVVHDLYEDFFGGWNITIVK